MKYLIISSLLITSSCAHQFKVGDCIRDLGHPTIEQITFITQGGAVETKYRSEYGILRMERYPDSKFFVPAQCPEGGVK